MLKMPRYLEELKSRGLSLRKFAKLVNLSPEWVSKVFNGEAEPSAETERKIKDALCTCPWCGSKWPSAPPFEGAASEKESSTARRV
jgi:transcriptional regulator with XRE-family HTH domain